MLNLMENPKTKNQSCLFVSFSHWFFKSVSMSVFMFSLDFSRFATKSCNISISTSCSLTSSLNESTRQFFDEFSELKLYKTDSEASQLHFNKFVDFKIAAYVSSWSIHFPSPCHTSSRVILYEQPLINSDSSANYLLLTRLHSL